jgi:predicted histone-like DNA-binding protein
MLKYAVFERVNPRDLDAPRKFYAVKQNQGTVSVRDLSRRISRETMLGLVETNAVIEALLAAVPALLAEGKLVSLGEFGSFRLTIKSDGTETPEAFNASFIRASRIHFRAGKEFADVLKLVEYSRVDNS